MDIKTIGVEEWLNVWEKSATWDIAQSTISSLTMGELRALDEQDGATFYERLDREKMNYGWIEGSPEFKVEVAKLYRREVNPDHILQTNGCTGAILNAIMAVVEPGDHVIAEWPTYAPLYEIPRTLGAEVEYWELREELGWKPDIEQLKRLVRPNTKLICINNPDNPTGALLDTDTLKAIVEVARKHDAWVLCDEVYRLLTQTDEYCESVIDLYDKAVVTASMSKVWSFAGLRLGWAVTKSPELRRALLSHRDYNLISAGIFSETVAGLILGNASVILERSRRIVRQNLAVLEKWVESEPHLSFVKPEAGTTALVYYDYDIDSRTFCIDMIKKSGALVTPGDCFEEPKSMRIGYAYSDNTDDLQKGLDAISAYMRTLE